MKNKTIKVEGKELKIVERMGWQHSTGVYAIEVETKDGNRIVTSVNRSGPYNFHKPIVLIGYQPFGQ